MKWLVMIVGGIFVGVLAATMAVSNQSPQQVGGKAKERTVSEQKRIPARVINGDKDAVIVEGYDPLWQTQTKIERRDGRYFLDGDRMEEKRHWNMPNDGLSLVLIDRIGEPDNNFLVRDGRMDIYTGCEYGPCTLKRTIRQ